MTGRANPLPGLTGLGRLALPGAISPLADSDFPNLASPSFRFNPADAAAEIAVSSDGYTATRSAAATTTSNVRSVTSYSTGLLMATFWPGADGADWQVDGVDMAFVAFANASASLTASLFSTTNAIVWLKDGQIRAGSFPGPATISPYNVGDQLDAVLDIDNELFWGRVNGGAWNKSASAVPGSVGGVNVSAYAGGATFAAVALTAPSLICRSKYVAVAAPTPPTGVTYPWGG